MKDNKNAFYIHCIAYQLQLALVVVTKKNVSIEMHFTVVNDIVNVLRGSSMHCDALIEN